MPQGESELLECTQGSLSSLADFSHRLMFHGYAGTVALWEMLPYEKWMPTLERVADPREVHIGHVKGMKRGMLHNLL